MGLFSFFDESGKQVIAVDKSGMVIYVNQAALRALEYDKGEIIGSNLSSFIVNGRNFPRIGTEDNFLTLLPKSGIALKCRFSTVNGRHEGKDIRLLIMSGTSRLQPEESEPALLSAMIDNVSDIIYIKDVNGVYLSCNRAFAEKCIGLPKREIQGKTDNDFMKYGKIARACTKTDKSVIKSRRSVSYEEPLILADKKEIIADTLKVPYFDENGNVKFIIGISRDITRRKNLEKELVKNNKRMKLMYELYNKASKHERLDQFIDYIKTTIIDLYDVDGILLYLYSESRNKMVLFSCHGMGKNFIDNASVLEEDDGILNPLVGDDPSVQGKI